MGESPPVNEIPTDEYNKRFHQILLFPTENGLESPNFAPTDTFETVGSNKEQSRRRKCD
jgi:hypothetical protein